MSNGGRAIHTQSPPWRPPGQRGAWVLVDPCLLAELRPSGLWGPPSLPAPQQPPSQPPIRDELGTPHPRLLGDGCPESQLSWQRKTPPATVCRAHLERQVLVHSMPRPLRKHFQYPLLRGFWSALSTLSVFSSGYEANVSATLFAQDVARSLGLRGWESPGLNPPLLITGKLSAPG